jgi:hypothetical protein
VQPWDLTAAENRSQHAPDDLTPDLASNGPGRALQHRFTSGLASAAPAGTAALGAFLLLTAFGRLQVSLQLAF